MQSLIALRLSPLAALLLCGLDLLALLAILFVAHAAVAPVVTAAAPKSEWRLPKFVAPDPHRAKLASSDVQTLARPIFSKSRRPLAERPNARLSKAPPSPPPAAPTVGLQAIVGSRSNGRAFLISRPFPEGKWYRVGEQIEGWTIADMQSSELTLTNNAHTVRLRLYPDLAR